MSKKNLKYLLTTLTITTTALILYYKNQKSKIKKNNEKAAIDHKQKGNKMYSNKNYKEAISEYHKALALVPIDSVEYLNILNNLSLICLTIRNYEETIYFCDRILNVEKFNVRANLRKYEALKSSNKEKEALFVISLLTYTNRNDRTIKSRADEHLQSYTKNKVEQIIEEKKKHFPEILAIQRVFVTFPGLIEKLKRKRNYQNYGNLKKIFYLREKSNDVLLVKALIEHIRNNHNKAIEILKESEYLYSIIFLEFLEVEYNNRVQISEKFKKLEKIAEDDITFMYYSMLIYSKLNNNKYEQYLNAGLKSKSNFLFYDFKIQLSLSQDSSNTSYLDDLIKKAVSETNHSDHILSFAIEFYHMTKNKDLFNEYYDIISKKFPFHHNSYLFLAFKYELENNTEEYERCLLDSIKDSKSHFKSYFYLGNYYLNNNDRRCKEYFESGLKFAYQEDEIYSSVHILTLIEIQQELSVKYPEIQSKTNN